MSIVQLLVPLRLVKSYSGGMDAVRKLILEKLMERGLTMKEASLHIGHSHSYLGYSDLSVESP